MENLILRAGRPRNAKPWLHHPREGPGWRVGGEGGGADHNLLLPTLKPLPRQGDRQETCLFFFSIFFFNPKSLFNCLEYDRQKNNFFLFFLPELSHLQTSRAPAFRRPAELYVTHLFPCSRRNSEPEASAAYKKLTAHIHIPTPSPLPPGCPVSNLRVNR